MTPSELSTAVLAALDAALAAGEIALPAESRPSQVRVERPKNREHGDYATNLAMTLAKPLGRPPREIAQVLSDVSVIEAAPQMEGRTMLVVLAPAKTSAKKKEKVEQPEAEAKA